VLVYSSIAVKGTPSLSYRVSLATWDHTVCSIIVVIIMVTSQKGHWSKGWQVLTLTLMWRLTLGITIEQLFICTRGNAIQKFGLVTLWTSKPMD